ncbi:restriction endonuclease subunit S [Rhizobium sp. ARZ01]|uniref:restriction endonuclease subunit S n=1 Tax=Rhizobium sp. ARZ01 TaxID=2769313 RepID=UPI00178203A3|nr:restriction endonuclease subunit S [Rhizobium sp. ARZ01]
MLDGDVILTREAPIGEVGYVSGLGTVFLGQRLMQYRPDPRKIVPRYLYYTFRSPDLQQQFGAHDGSGSVVSHIRVADCHEFKVSLPPKDHQERVVELLGALDDKIELNRQMNVTLEAMAQAIFRDWFVDFGPSRRKIEGASDPVEIMGGLVADAERSQQLADHFPARLGDDGLPEGWSVGRLEDVLELSYGKSLTKSDRRDGSFPVYGSGGIGGFHDAALVKGPSVIVGRKGTIGSLYWEDRDFYPIDTVFYVRSERPMIYCYHLLQTLGLDGMNTDAAVPGLNRSNAYRLEVAVASPAIVREFGRIAGLLRQRITSNEIECRTLAATRDLLLPKVMSGELSLRIAETQLEAAQ